MQDIILLKIHRNYSKEESIAYLFDQLKAKDVEIGKLKSQIFELQDINIKQKQKYSNLHTQLMLIKRYFKIKFNTAWGLKIIPKQKQLL